MDIAVRGRLGCQVHSHSQRLCEVVRRTSQGQHPAAPAFAKADCRDSRGVPDWVSLFRGQRSCPVPRKGERPRCPSSVSGASPCMGANLPFAEAPAASPFPPFFVVAAAARARDYHYGCWRFITRLATCLPHRREVLFNGRGATAVVPVDRSSDISRCWP